MVLEQLLKELRNWFRVRDEVDGIHPGSYTIQGGRITLPFLRSGQYYRIVGSIFNDGLHKYGDAAELQDENFVGAIWALAIPAAVIALAADIQAWADKYQATIDSPYASESFAGYSYTKATSGSSGSTAANDGWQGVFRARLAPWRKIREV